MPATSKFCLAILLTVGMLTALSGCASLTPRTALPVALDAPVAVEGLSNIRVRSDVVSRTVEQLAETAYRRILKTRGPGSFQSRSVDFLAISGGGADGAFAAGFLNGWSMSGTRPEFEVVTGVSTGALVAPFAFLGRDYDPQLKRVFTEISDADVYVNKGPIGFFGESLLDPTPLRNIIESILTDDFLDALAAQDRYGRLLLVQTADIERQVPYVWNITRIAATGGALRRKLITDILLASAAIPGVFPPVRMNVTIDGEEIEELHVDGGVAAQIFFAPEGLNLRKFETKHFGQPRQQRLYLIRNGKLVPETMPAQTQTLELAKLAIATMIKHQATEDIRRIRAGSARSGLETYITAIPPTFVEPQTSQFDKTYMRALFKTGSAIGKSPNRWVEPSALHAKH